MRVRMNSTERVYPEGFDSEPVIYRRGQIYDATADVAATLLDGGKATDADAPTGPSVTPSPGPSATKPAKPSRRA